MTRSWVVAVTLMAMGCGATTAVDPEVAPSERSPGALPDAPLTLAGLPVYVTALDAAPPGVRDVWGLVVAARAHRLPEDEESVVRELSGSFLGDHNQLIAAVEARIAQAAWTGADSGAPNTEPRQENKNNHQAQEESVCRVVEKSQSEKFSQIGSMVKPLRPNSFSA